MSRPKVPFTILTGFLGAGKTTALNRILAAAGRRRIAVLVNELGRIAIDGKLILSKGGDILELAGGCVCCKVDTKNDLWDGIADVIERSRPDHVVLETTGIAEPGAILDGFRYLPAEQQHLVEPVGIIAVVEAEAGPRVLREREEAREQILCADRLLLSKLDVATAEQARALHARLDTLNPNAERASFPPGESASQGLISWILERKQTRAPRPHSHNHSGGQLVAVSFSDPAPLLENRLMQLIEGFGAQLYRVKGFVNIAGEQRRGFLELAGDRVTLSYGEDWSHGDARESELVLIGDALDEAALRRQLWACRAG
ncbi:MAG: GTP-binding protein [Myxococcales bacterium]|nr:GTP-binding protein [Myxococcales bacterium]